eukprot:m.359664 g.359664  ORF g.359664 m.359664 type:complete len:471 (+) comp16632_c1_seq1:277-1689(+)
MTLAPLYLLGYIAIGRIPGAHSHASDLPNSVSRATPGLGSRVPPPDSDDPNRQWPYLLMYRFSLRNASALGALCGDGSTPVYYVRNCSANCYNGACNRPGDPDYCKRGGAQGVQRIQFLVYFEQNGYCFDKDSCGNRTAQHIGNISRSPTLFPNGMILPYPEANPNFYKASAVYIPSCSSDLFLGNRSDQDPSTGLYFQGARIARAILRELQTRQYWPSGRAGPLSDADDVVVVGGAGVVASAADLARAALPPQTRVVTVCDGCVVPENLAPFPSNRPQPSSTHDAKSLEPQTRGCLSWETCPPAEGWAAGLSLWGTTIVRTATELLSPALLTAALSPLLVHSPQLPVDSLLKPLGVWPLEGAPAKAAYATTVVAEAVRRAVEGVNATFVPTCSGPGAAVLTPGFYSTPALCQDGYGNRFEFTLSEVFGAVVDSGFYNGSLRCTPPVNGSTLHNCSLLDTRMIVMDGIVS